LRPRGASGDGALTRSDGWFYGPYKYKFGRYQGDCFMKAEDKLSLSDGTLDRDAWAALWNRLPERMRRGAAEFVLQKLHALESGGDWRIAWHYESTEHREESDAPTFEFDQPGDVITFKGSLQIGSVGEEARADPALLVSVACLNIVEWQALRHALPESSDLGDNFKDYTNRENQRFAALVRAGKNPCRVAIPAAVFLDWCASNGRTPDAASRDAFAAEKFRQEQTRFDMG
jgi:hypothetical protein